MNPSYDILIIGCGMSGGLAALTALKKGLSVCIIERRKRSLIGRKCCGELMPQETLLWLKKEFNIPIVYYPIKKLQICTRKEHKQSHSSLPGIVINQRLCTIDRYTFQQKMVRKLLQRGAVLQQGTVVSPVGKTQIRGVKTKESRTVLGKIIIDCSGSSSVLSNHIAFAGLQPPQIWGIAYKETLSFQEPMNGAIASIIMDINVGFSQYMWCFPKTLRESNTGIGGLGTNRSDLLHRFESMLRTHSFEIISRKERGFGTIPLGGPLPCAVGPGLMLCGDAAGHVNPLTGEGIAPALQAGFYAGTIAAEAIDAHDLSVKALWPYNREMARQTGILHMSFLLFREFLRSLPPQGLQFLLSHILSGNTLEQFEHDALSEIQKFRIALKTLKKPDLLFRLISMDRSIEKLRMLYTHYPYRMDGFPDWLSALKSVLHIHERPRLFSFN
jgi:digeranylgeranylglycerophospholipid reductase